MRPARQHAWRAEPTPPRQPTAGRAPAKRDWRETGKWGARHALPARQETTWRQALYALVAARVSRRPGKGRATLPMDPAAMVMERTAVGSFPPLSTWARSRLENWVNVLRLSPLATDTQRGLRSERGTPRFCAHALPSDPCKTGHGRQAGQAADRRKRHSQADLFFTFSRVEYWVNVSRLSPPAIDRPTEEP